MTQFAQGLGLNLTDTLAGNIELASDLLQSAGCPVMDTETQFKNFAFPVIKGTEHMSNLIFEHRLESRIRRGNRLLILDEVAEMRVSLIADGSLQRNRHLRDLKDLFDFADRHTHLFSDLLSSGFTAVLLHKKAGDSDDFIDGLGHMHRNPNGPRLVGDGTRDGLTDPPGGIRRKFIPALVLKFLHRADQSHVALLNQVQKRQSAVDIFFRDTDDQPQVGLDKQFLRLIEFGLSEFDNPHLFLHNPKGLPQSFQKSALLFLQIPGIGKFLTGLQRLLDFFNTLDHPLDLINDSFIEGSRQLKFREDNRRFIGTNLGMAHLIFDLHQVPDQFGPPFQLILDHVLHIDFTVEHLTNNLHGRLTGINGFVKGLGKLDLRFFDPFRETDLVFAGKERNRPHLLQIHFHRIV